VVLLVVGVVLVGVVVGWWIGGGKTRKAAGI
jgi:hypothetical protein